MLVPLIRGTVLLFTISTAAVSAGTQTFGPKAHPFTIDVPDNWSVTRQINGVSLTSRDGLNPIAVSVADTQGLSIGDLARISARAVNFTDISGSDDTWTIGGRIGDREVNILIVGLGGNKYLTSSIIAGDLEAAYEVFNTLDVKLPDDKP